MQNLRRVLGYVLRWVWRALALSICCVILLVVLGAVMRPFAGIYQLQEQARIGSIKQNWVALDQLSPVIVRSVIAAEDADFCQHHGVDIGALRQALDDGATRGASTITMQVAKNVYLWHGRSYLRKALELPIALLIDATWTKARILEVYLNVAEFDRGVFGIYAAAIHYFGQPPDQLTPRQAARLAAVLPNPQGRSAAQPSPMVAQRADKIMDGAATIAKDGRDHCITIG